MSSLEVRNLSKSLGTTLAVDDVSFRVEEGEFFVLLGASGSGKSTLLRLICGLETPDSGAIWIAGREVTGLPPRERNVGMVFQDYGLYPNMNVYDNIAYGLEARRMPRHEIEQRITQAAESLGLGEMLVRSIVDLSGGEQQRVALARALAKDADVYLFDEPLSNLDPKLRYQARVNILTLHRTKGKPSLYVTHDQAEAFAIADRLGVMAHGRILQIGTVDNLLHNPANLHIASFLGSPPMNLIEGTVEKQQDTLCFMTRNLTFTIPGPWQALLARRSHARLILGLRPEAIQLADGPAAAHLEEVQTFMARVAGVETLIGETIVSLDVGTQTHITALIEDDGETDLTPGQSLRLAIDPGQVRFFDPETEQALPL